MYKYSKFRQICATVAGAFGKTKAARRLNRDKVRYHGLISTVAQTRIPRQKYPVKIPVAFCFDANGCKKAAVTLKSLLTASKDRCDYDVYCIINKDVDKDLQNIIRNIVKGTKSSVHFIYGNNDFDKSNRRGWPVAMWYRLMLPKLLPNVSRIIYADIDMIFFNDLIDVYELDLGKNVIAAVPTRTDKYINSGFLLMDLDKIRKEKFYPKWIKASVENDFKNPDQDVLNTTLVGRIQFLPLRYNFQLSHGSRIFKIYSEAELDDLKHNLVCLHYSDFMKPWMEKSRRPVFSEYWWNVARQTGLFDNE
ncbi:MAG: glycosyltransferase family 8 protein [Alphaproteobacteria bacterium]|nr:glycosyltransferase family 8 protein [Alphaproteobacteria bacterium]